MAQKQKLELTWIVRAGLNPAPTYDANRRVIWGGRTPPLLTPDP